jgi:hypothetical protein
MYSYYAFRAMRFRIPKFVNICITTMQISQMVVGIAVNTLAFVVKNRGERCDVPYENIYWSFFMYFTYFVLFFHFFVNAYMKKPTCTRLPTGNGKLAENNEAKKQDHHHQTPIGNGSLTNGKFNGAPHTHDTNTKKNE